MSKTLFKTLKEMTKEERKKLFHSLFMSISMIFLMSGMALLLYSCKSEPVAYETYKAETDWDGVLKSGTWIRQSNNIAAMQDVERIKFLSLEGTSWTVRLEFSGAQSDECSAVMNKDSGSLNAGSVSYNVHLSEHEGYWLRLTSPSDEVADFILEN